MWDVSSNLSRVRQVLQAVGLPYDCFAGYSLRIGAATASVIQTLGRLSSKESRTPREELARYSTNSFSGHLGQSKA